MDDDDAASQVSFREERSWSFASAAAKLSGQSIMIFFLNGFDKYRHFQMTVRFRGISVIESFVSDSVRFDLGSKSRWQVHWATSHLQERRPPSARSGGVPLPIEPERRSGRHAGEAGREASHAHSQPLPT